MNVFAKKKELFVAVLSLGFFNCYVFWAIWLQIITTNLHLSFETHTQPKTS